MIHHYDALGAEILPVPQRWRHWRGFPWQIGEFSHLLA
jgi:hypothetical protein